MINAPCKDCNDREIGCHSICKRYIDFKTMKEEENAEVKRQKDVIYMMSERKAKASEKKRKRIRK